jgi:aspartyl-tRNA(Asn)/glutamyl-tRNA(Gln) amidotransferase subunit B
MEIVSEPDMRSPEEAGAYLTKLRQILRYLGTCDGNMDEGSMRADVNVSVRKAGEGYRTRCEVKNVNSVRFVMQAVEPRRAADRGLGIRRHGGAGDAPVRHGSAASRGPCARRRTRMTTATSPTPTCRRWCSSSPGWSS